MQPPGNEQKGSFGIKQKYGYKKNNFIPTVKICSGNLMLWGCFFFKGPENRASWIYHPGLLKLWMIWKDSVKKNGLVCPAQYSPTL